MFLQSQEMRGKRCACSAQFHEKTRKRIASENMHLFLRVPERYKKAAIIISEKDGISLELRKNINISRIDIIIAIALIVTILFFFSSGLLFLSLLILFRLIQIKCEQKRQGIIPGTTQAKAGLVAGVLSIAVGLMINYSPLLFFIVFILAIFAMLDGMLTIRYGDIYGLFAIMCGILGILISLFLFE